MKTNPTALPAVQQLSREI